MKIHTKYIQTNQIEYKIEANIHSQKDSYPHIYSTIFLSHSNAQTQIHLMIALYTSSRRTYTHLKPFERLSVSVHGARAVRK